MLDTVNDSSVTISIDTLYARLRNIGLTRSTVRNLLLPDWWCDEFEQREGTFFEAAAYIARRTGLDFSALIHEDQELSFPSDSGLCFKKRQGTEEKDLAIASGVAEQVAKSVAFACAREYQSVAGWNAEAVRREILSKHQWVNLDGLLDFCWNHGLPVVHLTNLPSGNGLKKFDGVAGVFEGRPVIATGKNHKSSAWMAFIVAHELGHIISGHVQEGECIVDENIELDGETDPQEKEADRFAVELIYGKNNVNYLQSGYLTANKLVNYALSQAEKDVVNPASIVLNHAWHKKQTVMTKKQQAIAWGISQNAIKELEGEFLAAPEIINRRLADNLDWDRLSDDNCDFLERMAETE